MRRVALILVVFCILACSHRLERTDDAFLKQCWGAVERPGHTYELNFEGMMFVGTEGGIFIYSRMCPDHRLKISHLDDGPSRQIDLIEAAAIKAGPIIGIRGRANVIPDRRRDEYQLSVRVVGLPLVAPMTVAEQAEFMRHFNIG